MSNYSYGNDLDIPIAIGFTIERIVFLAVFGIIFLIFLTQTIYQYTVDSTSFRKVKSVHTIFRVGGTLSALSLLVAYVDLYAIRYIYHPVIPRVLTNLGATLILGCYLGCVYFALKAVYLMADPGGKKITRVKIELIALFAFIMLVWAACGVAIYLLDRVWPGAVFWIIFLVECAICAAQLTYAFINISKELNVARNTIASLPSKSHLGEQYSDMQKLRDMNAQQSSTSLRDQSGSYEAEATASPSTPIDLAAQRSPRNINRAPVSSHGVPITSSVSGHVKRGSLFAPPKKSASHRHSLASSMQSGFITGTPQPQPRTSVSRSEDLKRVQTAPPASTSNGHGHSNGTPSTTTTSLTVDTSSAAGATSVSTPIKTTPVHISRYESRSHSVQLEVSPGRPERRRASTSADEYDTRTAAVSTSESQTLGGSSSSVVAQKPPLKRRRSLFRRKSFVRSHNRRLEKWRQFTIYSDIGLVVFTILCAGFNVTYLLQNLDEALYNSRRDVWENTFVIGQYITVALVLSLMLWFAYAPLPFITRFFRKCRGLFGGGDSKSEVPIPAGARNNLRGSILSVRSRSKTTSADRDSSDDTVTVERDRVESGAGDFDEEKSVEKIELVTVNVDRIQGV